MQLSLSLLRQHNTCFTTNLNLAQMITSHPTVFTNLHVCVCGHTYIGRSNRSMQTRVGEHIPKWLEKQFNTQTLISAGDRHPSSSIAKHIIEMNHKVNTKTAFKIIYRNNQGRILKFAEALAIRKLNPPLCVQKQFIVSLNLPW
ncbi:unnamed protein product [Heterobilharzia americana]|nr:unnamed protein product [Heterobilharzia americana]